MIGARIKEQRQKIRYTQKMLADKVSASPQVISNWERGYTEPSADDISRLSEALECSSDYLLGNSNNPTIIKSTNGLSDKDERDIAKRMEKIKKDLKEGNQDGEGLNFRGEPMSEEAMESLLEALEHAERIATLANKKFAPNKYREKN